MNIRLGIFVILLLHFSCSGPEISEEVASAYEDLPKHIDFNQHIKPILSDKCFICHGPDNAKIKAGLQLHTAEKGYAELKDSPGKYAIVPGNIRKSELITRILSDDAELIMPDPESNLTLTNKEKALLIKWIKDGAEYQDHWAFIPPKKYKIPEVQHNSDVVNPIDNFVIERLESENLEPAARADKELMLRRLSLDITGLPPTLAEIEEFVNDEHPDAYEKQVDRLLSSDHYGEQMATGWLDLSRFADTHGYSVDRYRDMSPWRDWVIKAFNENKPYDTFVTWQLAGDLLENPSKEMRIATAFNRLHPQNMEGGIVNEEFIIEYAVDRASTVGLAFMGLTVGCARCHDHKYDPISHKNFYEMTSFFNNLNESGQISWNSAMPVPTMLLTTEEEDEMIAYIESLVEDAEEKSVKSAEQVLESKFSNWLESKSYMKTLTVLPTDSLAAYFKLDDGNLKDHLHPDHEGIMKRESGTGQLTLIADGKFGDGVKFDGDTWIDLPKTGVFGRNERFSISVWANIPSAIKNGNIFHKGDGSILYNWRGYHLKIVDNQLEILLAHTAPGNSITEITKKEFPRDQWVHFAFTYDGSSKASGLKLYVDGEEMETEVKVDRLYKDILFRRSNEPSLQFGARWRGKGIKGGIIDEVKVYNKELTTLEIRLLSEHKSVIDITKKVPSELNDEEKKLLKDYYVGAVSKEVAKSYDELVKQRKSLVDSVENIQELMVMEETPEPVQAYLLDRGVYDARTIKVFPNTPEAIMPMPEEYPKNRLGFAQWLFDKDHPLTARVAVNRFWQNYFGRGLVKTSEDFGNQGEMPSHPELLDWLALHFIESGWDMKALQKMIVMSNTYRQESLASQEMLERDEDNILLARGPSQRLSGEMLRDNVLLASGLLNDTIGGKSVKPYQPAGLWKVNGAAYQEDKGEDLYRRSMYTIWKRSVPHPTIATFDAPDRSYCTILRQETNTPLQALVLLNDPTYIEAARVLGVQMLSEKDPLEGITKVFRKLTGRLPLTAELDGLNALYQEEYNMIAENPKKADGWLNSGQFRISSEEDRIRVAANAVVASTIMNTDAMITKR
ncbi:DUF1553 domain-containing protein [Portibacter lacus]|uniref:DUF1553 domain-containing protein n=1 Tax=Portibacter lacus TaxID=1099794 RepID=A0AA37WER7_9BACT|nr:DUF1553 domain-containing protein [Portibacter lacus]GLR16425.1 hypothetical protein GCM10007940_10400 [Portibacter lacus]